jgi:arylsulfatase A-like enzyme
MTTHLLPHLLIFNPDQWRADVMGHFGNSAAVTPNLDALAERDAVSFSHAFVQNPVCTPSRCSFMTGWYPHVRGHRTMFHMLQPDEPMLLRDLKNMGYFVWWGGKNDLVPGQNGFEDYCDIKYQNPGNPNRPRFRNLHAWDEWRGTADGDNFYSFLYGKIDTPGSEPYAFDDDWAMIEGAVDFIHNAPPDQPVCIYLPINYPHPPFAVEDPWYSLIDRNKIPPRIPPPETWDDFPSILSGIHKRQNLQTWNEAHWKELIAIYYGMCARVDSQFGMIVDALKHAEIYDETAIFFFSDHGEFAGNYGLVEKTQNTFQDCLTRVPFIIKPPQRTPIQPGIQDALVELVDLRATIEALTGLEPGHTHFGRSLLPLIAGETDEHRDAVFCEGGRIHGETHCMELESSSNQNPQGLYWPRVGLQSSEGPEHTKAVMCRTKTHKYVRRLYEKDELYDMAVDPQELRNQIDNPAYAEVLATLQDRLLTFFLETGDEVRHEPDRRW